MNKQELTDLLGGIVNKAVDVKVTEVTEKFETRIKGLENVEPKAIHTPGNVKDDGHLAQVGQTQFRLPGGSIIDVSRNWATVGKGLCRHDGPFVRLGEEAEGYFVKMKEYMEHNKDFVSKASTLTDVMRVADDSSAGLFVPEDIRYTMLQFAPPGTIVWPRAQVWPMTTDKIQWPKLEQTLTAGSEDFFGNMVMTWTEEGGQKTITKAEFGQVSLDCHELSAYTVVTDQLLEDSAINIGNLLVQLFQGAYWHYTDKVFINGFGGTRPLGILNDPGVNVQSRVVASTVRYEDLINMQATLPPMFDADSVWFMTKQVFAALRKQKDDNGSPIIQLGEGYNDFGQGIAGFALGVPIVMADYKCPTMGNRGDVILGSWKHYFIGERKTISVEMSRHAEFQHNRTAFRAKARLGGVAEQPLAFVVLNSTADASLS